MADTATLKVQVLQESLDRLEALATQTGLSTSDLVGEALANYLDLHEWQVRVVDEAVKEADAGGPFVEHEKVAAWMRSWGTEHELPRPE